MPDPEAKDMPDMSYFWWQREVKKKEQLRQIIKKAAEFLDKGFDEAAIQASFGDGSDSHAVDCLLPIRTAAKLARETLKKSEDIV